VSRSREARLWELPEFFSTFGFGRKSMLGIFLNRKRSASRAPRKKGLQGQEPRGTRRVEDLNGKESAVAERQPVLSCRRHSCAGEASARGERLFSLKYLGFISWLKWVSKID
jgi:hypothetical protein